MSVLDIRSTREEIEVSAASVLQLAQGPVDQNNPSAQLLFSVVVGVVIMLMFKRWGDKTIKSRDGSKDVWADILTMASAAILVAGPLGQTPLFTSLANKLKTIIESAAQAADIPGVAASGFLAFITGAVLFIVMWKQGKAYEKQEKWPNLIWFCLAYLALSSMVPYANDVLGFISGEIYARAVGVIFAIIGELVNTKF